MDINRIKYLVFLDPWSVETLLLICDLWHGCPIHWAAGQADKDVLDWNQANSESLDCISSSCLENVNELSDRLGSLHSLRYGKFSRNSSVNLLVQVP